MFDLEEALKNLPHHPGVYIMKDEEEEIIYIGKAVSLKNRVRQYFQNSKNHSPKVRVMVDNIDHFEYILTDSELEALILECNLIKKHKPKYNILLKDDKHYPYIKITLNETYPRILVVRKILKDGAKYFGPYSDATAVRDSIQLVKKIFPLRTCNRDVDFGKVCGRPCLNFYINRCIAPCQGNVEPKDYMEIIKKIIDLLSGKQDEIVRELKEKMDKAAESLDFEKAAELRDAISSIHTLQEKQKMISTAMLDEDVIAFTSGNEGSCVEMFFIRGGKLLGRENFYFDSIEEEPGEVLSQFLVQFYENSSFVPKEILLQQEIPELSIIEAFLTKKRGSRVQIKVPKRGEKNELMEMARKNAEAALIQMKFRFDNERSKTIGALEELHAILSLPKLPNRIEAYDISNIMGTDPVGSMVVFEGGKPKNKDYRRFKIKTIEQANDYGSLEEVLTRRFKRGLKELEAEATAAATAVAEPEEEAYGEAEDTKENRGKFSDFPDLILMDGGLGQVHIAERVLAEFKLSIPVCGMVKDDKHRTRGLIYLEEEAELARDCDAFKLITRIQDEAHRVAISYHRSLRSKGSVVSVLDDISGVGQKRRTALMKHFKTLEDIKQASVEELAAVKGMNKPAAEKIRAFFHDRIDQSGTGTGENQDGAEG